MVIQCRMCGGDLLFSPGDTYGQCANCGRKSPLPNVNDEQMLNRFRYADQLRRQHEFDRAMDAYGEILKENFRDAEAHWGAVLCRYGIEYVDDPVSGKRVPTCQRIQSLSILADEDYIAAVQYAPDAESRRLYEEEASYIAEVQKRFLEISRNEQPYDVFICYKEADENGQKTGDSVLAWDVYEYLTERGFHVFFSLVTLRAKLGHEFEPYIFSALQTAPVMLVIGTRPEYFNAVWVRNEWSRYQTLMKSASNRLLIPCIKDLDPSELPVELSGYQCQNMGDPAFRLNLYLSIKTALTVSRSPLQSAVRTESGAVTSLLGRAFFVLESGDFEKADELAEQALNNDYQSARAYLVKLMIDYKARLPQDLSSEKAPLTENKNYQFALRFANPELKVRLEGWNQAILDRIEAEKRAAEERRCRDQEATDKARREAEERKRREAEAAEKARREAEAEAEERRRKEVEAYEKKKKLEEDFRLRTEQYQREETAVNQLKHERQQLTDALKDAEEHLSHLRQQLSQLKGLFISSKRNELEQQIESALKAKSGLALQLKKKKAALETALKHLPEAPDPRELDDQIGKVFDTAGMYSEVVKWYRTAAEQGQAMAQVRLGDCLYHGKGIPQDYTEAVKWFREAAEQGDAWGQTYLGYCYEKGRGVTQDYSEAVKWYRKAVEQGNSDAQFRLGNCYDVGRGVQKDYNEATKWYRKAAEQGNASAQCNLGVFYDYGYGVAQDYQEAVKWYRKAAEQGDADAQNNLGICYRDGKGVTKDDQEAVKWFREAADQGYANAQYSLGICYEYGRGVIQDDQEAVKWCRKAADQGYAVAQTNLGAYFENGCGVTRDYQEAVRWYRKAAEQGNARAQFNLGNCYNKGQGAKQDDQEAVKWYRKAAEQGHVSAQCNIGYCYENGHGVIRDDQEAIMWYRKAAEQGYINARYALQRLEKKLDKS